MTARHKIGRREKDVPKQMEPDTSADTQVMTQVEKHHADDPKDSQGQKDKKEKQALQRRVVKQRVPPREQNIFL